MKVSRATLWDGVQVFILIWTYSVIHEIGVPGGESDIVQAFDKAFSVAVPILIFFLPVMTIREAYAMLTGKVIRTERLRSLPHPKRNGLLYLWTGSSALVLCVLIQFTTLSPSFVRDLALACGGVFVCLAIALRVMPARERQAGG